MIAQQLNLFDSPTIGLSKEFYDRLAKEAPKLCPECSRPVEQCECQKELDTVTLTLPLVYKKHW